MQLLYKPLPEQQKLQALALPLVHHRTIREVLAVPAFDSFRIPVGIPDKYEELYTKLQWELHLDENIAWAVIHASEGNHIRVSIRFTDVTKRHFLVATAYHKENQRTAKNLAAYITMASKSYQAIHTRVTEYWKKKNIDEFSTMPEPLEPWRKVFATILDERFPKATNYKIGFVKIEKV